MSVLASRLGHHAHRHIDWQAGAWAGVIAGVAYILLEMTIVRLFDGQVPWEPRRMIAAIAVGEEVLPAPVPFSIAMLTLTALIHFMLSVIYGLIGAAILNRLHYRGATIAGAAFGFAIYTVNFYVIAPVIFPWFVGARGWISLFDHVAFGAVIGAAYIWLKNRREYARGRLFA
jgi:hypothetical protein